MTQISDATFDTLSRRFFTTRAALAIAREKDSGQFLTAYGAPNPYIVHDGHGSNYEERHHLADWQQRMLADPEHKSKREKHYERKFGIRATDNQPGGRDLIGHSGVQPWSAGAIFPAVIQRVEDYDGLVNLLIVKGGRSFDTGEQRPLEHRLRSTTWTVILDGIESTDFPGYDEAEQYAANMIAFPTAREIRRTAVQR